MIMSSDAARHVRYMVIRYAEDSWQVYDIVARRTLLVGTWEDCVQYARMAHKQLELL